MQKKLLLITAKKNIVSFKNNNSLHLVKRKLFIETKMNTYITYETETTYSHRQYSLNNLNVIWRCTGMKQRHAKQKIKIFGTQQQLSTAYAQIVILRTTSALARWHAFPRKQINKQLFFVCGWLPYV